jgi:hypothetical protein
MRAWTIVLASPSDTSVAMATGTASRPRNSSRQATTAVPALTGHQPPGLPQVQEELRLTDQGAGRTADGRAAGPAGNRILALRRIRFLVKRHL